MSDNNSHYQPCQASVTVGVHGDSAVLPPIGPGVEWLEKNMRTNRWIWLPVAAVSTSVYATNYLSVEKAQQIIFPGITLNEFPLTLTEAQRQQIEKKAGVKLPSSVIRVWRAPSGGFFLVDDVVGKHDFITYAVGLNPDGSVKQIEILDYRENYGHEIRNENWRRQFVGKFSTDAVRLDEDIGNISGATLSCRHLAEGVRRLLAVYEVALKAK